MIGITGTFGVQAWKAAHPGFEIGVVCSKNPPEMGPSDLTSSMGQAV